MHRWLILVFLLACTACGAPQSCAKQSPEFAKGLDGVMQEWQDATKLAGSTPRASLSAQVGVLQSIRRKTQALEVPECGKTAQAALITAMDSQIEGFTAFLAQASDADVQAKFTVAATKFQEANAEIIRLGEVPK